MTDQIRDSVIFRARETTLAGYFGEGLFRPESYGLEPQGWCTANYRGFFCEYEVASDDGRLLLQTLTLYPADKNGLPELFGVAPSPLGPRFGLWRYERLHAPVAFTGGLIVGEHTRRGMKDKEARELWHWRYHYPGLDLAVVWELIFEDGRLTAAHDRSEAFAARRAEISRGRAKGRHVNPAESAFRVLEWVQETLVYGYDSDA